MNEAILVTGVENPKTRHLSTDVILHDLDFILHRIPSPHRLEVKRTGRSDRLRAAVSWNRLAAVIRGTPSGVVRVHVDRCANNWNEEQIIEN